MGLMKNKKKGGSLTTVLILATAIMIIGGQVATSVVQTRKINERFNTVDDLELLARSGCDFGKNYLFSEINKLKENVLKDLNSIAELNSSLNKEILKEISIDNGFELDVKIEKEKQDELTNKSGKFKIVSVARWKEKNIEKQVDDIISVILSDDNTTKPDNSVDRPEDVDESRVGALNQMFYNVDHMQAISNAAGWKDRNKTFKNALNRAEIIPATVSNTYIAYTGNTYNENDRTSIITNTTTTTIFNNHTQHVSNYKEAKKVWGYFKAPETGYYRFRIQSDDGVAFVINNEEILINNFQPKYYNPFDYANKNVYLEKDKFYPIYIEYFNWGGGAKFILEFNTNKRDKNLGVNEYEYEIIPSKMFYPSKISIPPYNFN